VVRPTDDFLKQQENPFPRADVRFANDFHGMDLFATAAGSSFMPIMYVTVSIKDLSRLADAPRIRER
jgi:hypothetical protein